MTDKSVAPLPEIPAVLHDLSLTLSIRVGTATKTVQDLLALQQGTEVKLSSKVDDPVEICVEGRVLARGELVAAEDGKGLSVRITELVAPVA